MSTLPIFNDKLFSFCGQHCILCMVHKLKTKPCEGCSGNGCGNTIQAAKKCGIRICAGVKNNDFCKDCAKYPCSKLVKLSKKYH